MNKKINFSANPYGAEERFQRYYYETRDPQNTTRLERRLELIDEFKYYEDYCTKALTHGLCKYVEERKVLVDICLSRTGSHLTTLLYAKVLTPDERKIVVEKIYNATDYIIQEWFINLEDTTKEEIQRIRNIKASDRNDHDCYMFLMHNSRINEDKREEAFQSVLDRGIIYYLKSILEAPYVYNPAWIPSEKHKEITRKRIEELREGSKLFKNRKVKFAPKGGCEIFIKEHKTSYHFDSLWTANKLSYGIEYADCRIKDGKIIEIEMEKS